MTSLPLLRNVVGDLENARNNEECSLTLYFTKESHIHTLVNLVLQSGLPIVNRRIPELDYCVCVPFKSVIVAVSDTKFASHISPSSYTSGTTGVASRIRSIRSGSR